MAKNKEPRTDGFETIETTLTKGEQFIEKYQKQITIGFLAIIAVVSLYIVYKRFYKEPLEKEALEQMRFAERNFAKDAYEVAINGDGQFPGFKSIVEEYGSTEAGNMAKLYLGISYYKTKKYDEAIDELNDFKSDNPILKPLAYGNIGDAYAEKNELSTAAEYYEKAAKYSDNTLTAPIYYMKAAQAYENAKDVEQALEIYNIIKRDYKKTAEGAVVDKYISRLTAGA